VLVLGKNSDEKGTQLENLTKTLLTAKQYRNVCKNSIGAGGQEIDVRAEYLVPSLKDSKTFKVICECKAYKTPVDLPQWLKFYGKLCVERQTQSPDTQGCFIALSGVNGNVTGSYDELKKHNANVELITGDDLLDLIRQVYSLRDLKGILDLVKAATDRVCRESEAVYYDQQVYWLLLFEHETYTVLKGDGKVLTADEVTALKPMIEEAVSANNYINLEEEAQAKLRALMAETILVSYLMLSGGRASAPTIAGQQKSGLTLQEIERAAERLLEQHMIEGDAKGELQLPEQDYK
jgi:hypothetical protein